MRLITRVTQHTLALALLLIPIAGQAQYVTILHFNDFHGHLLPKQQDDESIGGMARLATMVNETRAWNEPHNVTTLLLEAGDILQGTPLSTVFQGEPDFICLNMIGVDVMAVGNHEFDFGQENLHERMQQAVFPIVSANIEYANTMELFTEAYATTEIEGVPALIFGVTSEDTPIESNAKNVVGLKFRNPTEVAREIVAEHGDDYPIIIALTHIGLKQDLELAEAVDGIDIIIGGHSNDVVEKPIVVGDTLVCMAGGENEYLGQLDVYFNDGDIVKHRGFLRSVDSSVPEDPEIVAVVAHYAEQLNEEIKRVVATSNVPLDGVRDNLRSGETNLGDLIADILLRFSEADVA
ncbi:MAG TPA: bifunctional UDP-sugar hydrolase/5'-nucleotidase, partial [Armatimonadota bacterium]|nr:bifunctional UDP-sugar hydrolase/5'-nucleotidase [Armatimonadota bacterium]